MRKKNMDIPQNIAAKKVLLESIKREKFKNVHVINEICKNLGHTLLRLPPYYCIFNPIEMVWASVKHKLHKINQSPNLSAPVLENIRIVINDLGKSDIWRQWFVMLYRRKVNTLLHHLSSPL